MKIFLTFFLFYIISGATAQKSNRIVQWVNDDDGLHQLSVSECVTDNNGYVWIATNLGLYRYDWKKATLVKNAKYHTLDKQIINGLYKDPATGTIYFQGKTEGKNYCIENNEIKRVAASEGIYISNDVFVKSNNPLFPSISHYLNSNRIFDRAYFSSNNNAIITKNFYYTLSKNKIVILNKKGIAKVIYFPNVEKTMIFKDRGYVFVANKAKIVMLTGTTITNDHVKADKIIEAFIASEDYLTKRHAVFFFEDKFYINFNNSIYKIDYEDGMLTASFVFSSPINEYSKFSYSKMHKLYVGGSSSSGMVILRKNNFNTIPKQKNRKGYSDYVVVKKNDNWYNLTGWIYNKSTKQNKNRWLDNMSINMGFLLEYQNDFYFESDDRRLTSLTNLNNKLPFKTNDQVFPMNHLTGYTYIEDKLWLAKDKTVSIIINNKLIADSLITKQFKKDQVINALSTFNGQLIVATTNGVFLYKPFSGKIRYIQGLENVNARYIKHIDKSNYWVGCYGNGLFIVHKNKAYKVVNKDIDITTAHAIEEDNEGNLWISTNNGLLNANKQKVISNTLKNIPIESYLFTISDGLPTNEFNGGGTFPSLQDTDGTIGFPSIKGFVWFHPDNVKKQVFSGSISIDELLINNKKILQSANDLYKIPNDAEIISIRFSYAYPGNMQNLNLYYKFEDQETWTECKNTVINLPRYKKGKHKLLIKIKTHGFDDKYDVIKFVELNFEPRIVETQLFWIIIGYISFFIIVGSYNLGLYYKRSKEIELKEKIDIKTQQLQEIIIELSLTKKIIKDSLAEKNVLLKEVHHRVKNNLQLIISMLNIQARRKNYSNIDEFLTKGETRISAMALIHQSLYQSEESLDKINFQLYLHDLIDSIRQTFEVQDEVITITIEANDIILNLPTAIPVGLIINELVTNSFKHAFPNNRKGVVSISIEKQEANKFILSVEDNGIGISISEKKSKSFGVELINLLAIQLKGSVKLENYNSTKYTIHFTEIVM